MLGSPFAFNDQMLADEGSLIVGSLGPGATSLQLGLSAAFAGAAPAVVLFNSDSSNYDGAKRLYPRFLKFNVVTAPTSGTALWMATVLDTGNRAPTTVVNLVGGTPATATAGLVPAVNTSGDVGSTPVGKAYFPLSTAAGAPPAVPAATQSARTLMGNLNLRTGIPIVGDEVFVQFGMADYPKVFAPAAITTPARETFFHPGVVVPPGGTLLIYLWAPGNVTAGLAFSGMDIGWAER